MRMRDLVTADLDEEFATIFRTLRVAFAYAEMSAAFERFAAENLEPSPDDPFEGDIDASGAHFVALSDRLQDRGIDDVAIRAWDREQARRQAVPEARVLH